MDSKLFYSISKRLREAEEKFEEEKKAKSFGTVEFIAAKVRYETLRETYNLLYL